MEYRKLGNTGLEVSALSVGTVSLGVPYGIRVSGDYGMPDQLDAVRLLNEAADAGINLFDTAPAYGHSEQLLGQAFSTCPHLYIATKVSLPCQRTVSERRKNVMESLFTSLRNLKREALDIVQIHNAKAEDIEQGEMIGFLQEAQRKGFVRFLGASVYGEEAAAKVIENQGLDVLQIAYNILDQRPCQSSFRLAAKTNTGILSRSALLKGVLSKKAVALPDQLKALKHAAEKVRSELDCSWSELPEVATRFCLSSQRVSSVLVGVRTREELHQALAAWHAGPLSEDDLKIAPALALNEEFLINPSHWPIT